MMLGVARRVCASGRTALVTMSKQPVSTSSYAMVKAIEDLEQNPYFDKYAAKIAMLQKYVLFLVILSILLRVNWPNILTFSRRLS